MSGFRLEYNEDGKVLGFRLDGVEVMNSSNGIITFYADNLYDVNPQTGNKTEIRPAVVVRNGEDIVSINNYVKPSYIFGGK